jgi:protein phosphatase
MAVGHQHEMYIAHVGDSRAYWITRTGCHQITLDDDVAAREVRLGYAVYREALQQPSAGSLVQAIGMSASVHPTVQRFVLDEDCIFLLCSDGLSDYDLVDRCWQTDILPILDGSIDVATATQHLVELGNNLNGHDNITVALVHCQVNVQEPQAPLNYSRSLPPIEKTSNGAVNSNSSSGEAIALAPDADDLVDDLGNYEPIANTQLLPPLPSPQKPRQWLLPTLLGIGLVLSAGGGLWLALSKRQPQSVNNNTEQIAPSSGLPVAPSTTSTEPKVENREAGRQGDEGTRGQGGQGK